MSPGIRLGPYEITSPLGSGGMGEVWQARDTRLGREVAIKFLTADYAENADQLRRFEQEARTLAALNHPNILSIFDTGTHDGQPYLVSELLEGQTLREVLSGVPLPARKAIEYALQVAQGLSAAHSKGVIHRDLKPENLFVTQDGRVKILDFGLAKLKDPSPARRAPSPLGGERDGVRGEAVESDALTLLQSTQPGMVLGTPSYMSPEQVRGEAADHRSDIFAFGAILYEMLSGQRAFRRDTHVETMNAILNEEPPELAEQLPNLPMALERILRRCLEKQPERRFQTACDLAFALEGLAGSRFDKGSENDLTKPSSQWLIHREKAAWAVAIVALLALLASWRGGWPWETAPESRSASAANWVSRTVIELPANAPLALGGHTSILDGYEGPVLAVSPDGKELVYVGTKRSSTQLYRRAMDGWESVAIPGTDGAVHPFFSPDGQSIGFLTRDKVLKVSLRDGAVVPLCNARTPARASWTDDGWIYVGEAEGSLLSRVREGGGQLEVVRALSGTLNQVLPDGKSVLVTTRVNSIGGDSAEIRLLSLETGLTNLLISAGYNGRYVPSGHLVFGRAGALFAVAFDLEQLKVSGNPVQVVAGVSMQSMFGHAEFAVSETGHLVYAPGGDRARGRIASVDREGNTEFLEAPEQLYGVFKLSPENDRLAVTVVDVNDYLWIYDLQRKEGRKLTPLQSGYRPKWSPNGKEIVYLSGQWGSRKLMKLQVDGSRKPDELLTGMEIHSDHAWSPDGRTFALVLRETNSFVLASLDIDRRTPQKRLQIAGTSVGQLDFSPDGHWVTYISDKSGQYEIWVRSFTDGTIERQISVDGGLEPVWCRSGELFYRKGDQWMSTFIKTEPELRWEPPRRAFQTDFIDTIGVSYDVSRDGQRLFVAKHTKPVVTNKLHVVHNWFAELNRLVSAASRLK